MRDILQWLMWESLAFIYTLSFRKNIFKPNSFVPNKIHSTLIHNHFKMHNIYVFLHRNYRFILFEFSSFLDFLFMWIEWYVWTFRLMDFLFHLVCFCLFCGFIHHFNVGQENVVYYFMNSVNADGPSFIFG